MAWLFFRKKKILSPYEEVLKSIKEREEICWNMAKVFLENKDAHGIHDMGVELQSLHRARSELLKHEELETERKKKGKRKK